LDDNHREEQQKILEADRWASVHKRHPVDKRFGHNLHHRVFPQCLELVRLRTARLFGVDWQVNLPRLYEAMEQTKFWIDNKTFLPNEIAVRFHDTLAVPANCNPSCRNC
jgi:hypothetical protein